MPLLPSDVAAYLATSAELGLSVLLVIGLFGRFAAARLSILNVVAVISYSELSEAGIDQHNSWGIQHNSWGIQHNSWGILLGVLLILSCGNWSVDAWLERRPHKSN